MGGLDPPNETGLRERRENAVHGLHGRSREFGQNRLEDPVGVDVRLATEGIQHGDPRCGHPKTRETKALGRGHRIRLMCRHAPNPRALF